MNQVAEEQRMVEEMETVEMMMKMAAAALGQTHRHPLPLEVPDVLMDTIEAQVVIVKE